jgi:hypothetical protein
VPALIALAGLVACRSRGGAPEADGPGARALLANIEARFSLGKHVERPDRPFVADGKNGLSLAAGPAAKPSWTAATALSRRFC